MMPGVTSLPVALRGCKMIPLRAGTKSPMVSRATFEAAAPWDHGVEKFLASGGRVGIFMGGTLVGLDIDVKIAYHSEHSGNDASMVMVSGHQDLERLLAVAGMSELPRTLTIRTPSGGLHYYFTQNPGFQVTQCTIGCLDVRAAKNSYLAIGEGYEIIDDGGGQLAVLPEAVGRAISAVPHNRTDLGSVQAERDGGQYGNYATAFNSALTTLKGTMIGMGWPELEANDAIRAINAQAPDPIDEATLAGTVLRDKGWEQGQKLRESEAEWARRQLGLAADDPDAGRMDIPTVNRLWTTERWHMKQEMEQLDPPERERLADVLEEEPPPWIMDGLMTVGLYGLAGPQEAGKSLLVRDWLSAVSNGHSWRGYKAAAREVSYVISEGHFDLDQRFTGISMNSIFIYRKPVMLTNEMAVDRFIEQHDGHDTGLVVFDIIYHMGVGDDNTMKDVRPVLQSCRRISFEMNCAVIVVGHPGHATGRRFRGTSIWRNWFDGEFHMADGLLTCEKHKYARKEAMEWNYEIEWPRVKFLSEGEVIGRESVLANLRQLMIDDPNQSGRYYRRMMLERYGVPDSTTKNYLAVLAKEA